ncbi:MAG TPA: alpha/beta hydrolase [Thermoanaerobaculia bacterium]|nr:alpha/beta hydrolase [Thermoanaerobaculia bacterium]
MDRDSLPAKMIKRMLTFALLLLAALWLFTQYLRRTSMFFPSREGNYDAKAYQIVPEEVWFHAADGVKLHGWLFRGGEPLLIWFHGNGGNLTDRAGMAAELASRGVSVFLFDWRGYGKSEGTPSESGLYEDALAAYGAVNHHSVILYGESLGGPYAAYVAKNRKVKAVIIENSFPSLAAMGNRLYGLGWLAPRALRTTDWLNQANVPVLVMHGKRDQVIPFELGMRLYEGLTTKKQLLVSQTAGHCEIPAVEPERYYAAVMDMCRTSTGPQSR